MEVSYRIFRVHWFTNSNSQFKNRIEVILFRIKEQESFSEKENSSFLGQKKSDTKASEI